MHPELDQLKRWILDRHRELTDVDEDLDLIESRLIDSLSFIEFVFLVGQLSNRMIDLQTESIDKFRTLRRIDDAFFRSEVV